MKTEKEKMLLGEIYDANYDPQLLHERTECADVLHEWNQIRPSDKDRRDETIRRLFASTGKSFTIVSPFFCDYGYNIHVGENFFMNTSCVILDEAKVTFGNNVFIAPHCGFYTAGHPVDAEQRNRGLEYARPITVGNDVWIGAHVCVLPGVSIGNNCVIGAGSVVCKDIPDNSVAVGNPCRVIRQITANDRRH